MAYRDPEARRAYARRYYAQNRDTILARQRARKAARSPEHLELLRARDRERKRRQHEAGTAGESDARREASRRWRQRNSKQYGPRRRQLDRERYSANRDAILSANRQRYAADTEYANQTRARNRAWYGRNRERRRESKQRYYFANADELRARQRQKNRRRYAANPRAALDYYKRWRERNLVKARAYVRAAGIKRRAASQGQHFTAQEWLALVEQHGSCCAYCETPSDRLEADHRVPLCRGGSNLIENILPACITCNRRKHRKTEQEFRALLAAEGACS